MSYPTSEKLGAIDGFVVITSDLKQSFFKASDQGVFERLRTLDDSDDSKYIGALYRGGDVVGLAEFDVFTEYGYQVNIKFIEVAEPFWGNQYGLYLLREAFKYADINRSDDIKALITTSGFTGKGQEHIRPYIDEVSDEFEDVEFGSYPTA